MLEQKISNINNETLNFTIIPFEALEYGNDDYNKSRLDTKLNFTWICTEFDAWSMHIQINFTDVIYVSYGGKDIL